MWMFKTSSNGDKTLGPVIYEQSGELGERIWHTPASIVVVDFSTQVVNRTKRTDNLCSTCLCVPYRFHSFEVI